MSPEVVQQLKKFNEAITAVEDALQKNFSLDPEQRREVRIFFRRSGHVKYMKFVDTVNIVEYNGLFPFLTFPL